MKNNGFRIENSGDNQGIIVGQNTGTINISLKTVVKIPSLISTVVKSLGGICTQDEYNENVGTLQEYKPDEKSNIIV